MKLSKVFNGLLYFGVAFCVGSCKIFGINPCGVGFVCACCLTGEGAFFAYLGVLLGCFLQLSWLHVLRYGILLLGVLGIFQIRQVRLLLGKPFELSLLTGVYVSAVNVFCSLLLSHSVAWLGVSEGLLCFSLTFIYQVAIRHIRQDYMGIFRDNQAMIGVVALGITVIYGAPVYLVGRLVFAELLCLFSMLVILYKFGLSVGVAWAAICGGILAYRLEAPNLLLAWVFLLLITYVLGSLFHAGRHLFAGIFAGSYLLLGTQAAPDLLGEDSLKAACTALFLFLFLPAHLLLSVDGSLAEGERDGGQEWGELVMGRMKSLAAALKRIDYTFAVEGNTGIGFRQVGAMLEQFTEDLDRQVPLKKTVETGILEELGHLGIQVKSLSLLKSAQGQYRIFLSARVRRGRLVGAETVRSIVSRRLKLPMELTEESRQLVGRSYDLICLRQKPEYRLLVAARCLAVREDFASGDTYYIGDIPQGKKLVMLADGMGNGERAALDSSRLVESLEELLAAGFNYNLSVQVVNAYLSEKYRGEHFSTLDMLLLDTYTGYGNMIKHGAAGTYIRRGNWLECVKSTSLPVGVTQEKSFESCGKKFYHGDLIVMLSDGVAESILVENKDDYMRELILNLDSDEPEDVVEEIVSEIRRTSGRRLVDDATVVACKLVKSL